jgi:hypothetical protein
MQTGPVRVGTSQPWQETPSGVSSKTASPLSHSFVPKNEPTSVAEELKEKKIVKINSDVFPSIYGFPKSTKMVETGKTHMQSLLKQMKEDPNNLSLPTEYVAAALTVASCFRAANLSKTENELIKFAETTASRQATSNYFSTWSHYSKFLLLAYHGVNCRNIETIKSGILALRRAIELDFDSTNTYASKSLDNLMNFLAQRWQELAEKGEMSHEDRINFLEELKNLIEKEDPFKEEFRDNPDLFKIARQQAPNQFFEKHPAYASMESFVQRYPECTRLGLPGGIYNLENLKTCVSQAEAKPLIQSVCLISLNPLLVPAHAKHLKQLLLDQQGKRDMGIVLGNMDDVDTLTNAFYMDSKLKIYESSLKAEVLNVETDNYKGKCYRVFIDKKYPIQVLK